MHSITHHITPKISHACPGHLTQNHYIPIPTPTPTSDTVVPHPMTRPPNHQTTTDDDTATYHQRRKRNTSSTKQTSSYIYIFRKFQDVAYTTPQTPHPAYSPHSPSYTTTNPPSQNPAPSEPARAKSHNQQDKKFPHVSVYAYICVKKKRPHYL